MTGKLGKYTTILAVLVVAIVAIAAGLLATLLQASADRLDRQQLASEKVIVRSVVKRQLAKLDANVRDYALWDDMYDRFQGKPNPQWDVENLGRYGAASFQLDHILVVSADGRIAYSYGVKADGAAPVSEADQKRLQAIAAPLIADGRAAKLHTATGVVEFAGEPQFVAIHPIGVTSEKRKARGELPNFALVYLKTIDAAYLATVAEDFNLGGLAVPMSGWMDSLQGPAGMAPAYGLTWNSSPGGKQFVSESTNMLLAVAPVVAAMLIALAFGWVAVVNQARDAEVRSVQAQVEAAEETSRAKSLFIANMSHEFRTPLNAVNGLSELIKNDTLDLGAPEKYKEYAGDIMASGQHLLRIVNNLLLFSKIEAKQHQASLEAVSLAEEVTSTYRMLRVLAEQRGVQLTCQYIAPSVLVMADRQALVQIVVNVVGNALKFSPANSQVSVEFAVMRELGLCDVRIVDQGCGIPEKVLQQLGQPFVQAEGTYTRREQGTGLGLAICLKLAAQMGARLTIDSVEEKGTTVTLRLPLAVAPEAVEGLVSRAVAAA
ncbi:MAG: ATP-binding protein [Micropepsaceae bacterium]